MADQPDNILDAMLALAKKNARVAGMLRRAASDALDKLDAIERRREAKRLRSRWVERGGHRSFESVQKGEATKLRNRRNRSRVRSNARRKAQKTALAERRFTRKMSAAAIILSAMTPGQWHFRRDIRDACPELPDGTLCVSLSQRLLSCPALIERAQNPLWDGTRGSLRPAGEDDNPERVSRWRYRLTAAGEAARAEVISDPARWTVAARWKAGLENAHATPQPHSWAAFGGKPGRRPADQTNKR